MSDVEYLIVALLVPVAYVLMYIAGKYDVLDVFCKGLQEKAEKCSREIERKKEVMKLYKDKTERPGWIPQDETLTKFMCRYCETKNNDGSGNYCSNCGANMCKKVEE